MTNERIIVRAKALSNEDLHFQEQDKKKIEEIRAKAAKEANEDYLNAHRNHCFRCGTPSLVEVDYRSVMIDLCVNDGCSAVHLDPGEMEKILEGERGLFYRATLEYAVWVGIGSVIMRATVPSHTMMPAGSVIRSENDVRHFRLTNVKEDEYRENVSAVSQTLRQGYIDLYRDSNIESVSG
ncbi:MAG: zf-TFIIB domain-containing protein [Deltaproteobacteria bacterium]|nr:zf-TFIIB domain-containing protein [Deltaproteobacteria bacterium]